MKGKSMSNESIDKKTLSKNCIKNFILKVDIIKNENCKLNQIAEDLSESFDRVEKRQINNLTINFTSNNADLCKNQSFNYVLISESDSIMVTFSESSNSFWIESSQYKSNSVYKKIVEKIVKVGSDLCGEFESKRIGLRYINEFKCDKLKELSNIYDKRLASIVKSMLVGKKQIRAICVEEYNVDEYKWRLQYGIPNKFYPEPISVFDLLLDIDVYDEQVCKINEWEEKIKILNHAAYECFEKEVNSNYLKRLK